MTADIAYYKRCCEHALEVQGHTHESLKTFWSFASREDQLRAWLPDVLLQSLAAMERRDFPCAMRCLLLAHSYMGQIGHWPGPTMSDCAGSIQSHLEALLRVAQYETRD